MVASFDSHLFWSALTSGPYWRGALTAFELTAASLATALVIGFVVALGALSSRRPARAASWIYNWLFRATPTLLQLYFVWDVLPTLWSGFAQSWFTPFLAAWIALSLNEAAYLSEIIRSGLMSVDPGQELAGRALGMPRRTILRRVVVPQAVRIVIPPVTNDFIALFKDTSICSMILITELTGLYYQYKYDRDLVLQLALTIALIYLLISYPLSILATRLERRLAGGRDRA